MRRVWELLRQLTDPSADAPRHPRQRRWCTKGDQRLARLLEVAAAHDGVVTRTTARRAGLPAFGHLIRAVRSSRAPREWTVGADRLQLRACPHCGSRRRVALATRECYEPVCSDCERDTTGIRWPLAEYAPWVLGATRPAAV